MRIEKIIVFLALFAVLATAVFAATVTHPAENIRAGIFGNAYAGNWSFINGSVGIGTTSPTATLQVNSSSSDGAFLVSNTSGSPLLFVNGGNGRVGIGTTNPSRKLHINYSNAHGYLRMDRDNTDTEILLTFATGGPEKWYIGQRAVAPKGGFHIYSSDVGADVMAIDNTTGNVGIGTTNPDSKLHINSTGSDVLRVQSTTNTANILVSTSAGQHTEMASNPAGFYINAPIAGHNISFYTQGIPTQGIFIKAGGNVGIGTTNPIGKFQVGNNTFNATHGFATDNSRVIGLFDDSAGGSSVGGVAITGTYNNPSYPNYGLVFIEGANTSNYNVWSISPDGPAAGSKLNFIYGANATNIHVLTPKVVFDGSTGNVGIGTATPTSTLHVIGTGNFSSNLYAGSCTGTNKLCSDIAETIASSSKLEPGDVVVIDTAGNERIKKSNEPYDTKVAGIVSSSPAIVLKGDQALLGREVFDYKDDVPLALAGRVPVKATAENGAIKAGDLLTTSSIPGHAMKCNDKIKCIGAIVGKALEPLDSGSGKITALVTLQ